eukprot:1274246-Pleurochrysis_carterae.AAC.1
MVQIEAIETTTQRSAQKASLTLRMHLLRRAVGSDSTSSSGLPVQLILVTHAPIALDHWIRPPHQNLPSRTDWLNRHSRTPPPLRSPRLIPEFLPFRRREAFEQSRD